ncbi:MAG: amidase, partial [Actinobacteria bacterium]|nr:amidase [Actinomycetota bacterium]
MERTAVARVEAALQAIDEAQPGLNAFTSVLADEALAQAQGLDGQDPVGPLHGQPIVVKDLFDIAGVPTTGACAAYEGRVATDDSDVVAALRAAGAVIVAKTNQHELGGGATGLVSAYGPVWNPWGQGRIAGGSSSGSAVAVAAGVVALAVGSDTGGSIRMPSSFCGITGLKPTHGRISLRGAMPMSPVYDTAGAMAETAAQCAVLFRVLSAGGLVPSRPARAAQGLRIGLPAPFFRLVHPETRTATEAAAGTLEKLGAVVEPLDGPGIDEDWLGFHHVWADLAHLHAGIVGDERISPELTSLINFGLRLSGTGYAASMARAREMREDFEVALRRVDALLTPCTPYPAPRATDEEVEVDGGVLDVHRGAPSRLTYPVNAAGFPAVAFPVGRSAEGLPLGAQLIGAPYDEETLLAVVDAFQAVSSHHGQRSSRLLG